MLSRMALEGMVVRGTKAREGDRGRATVHTYTLNPDPAARPPIPPKLKLRKPTTAGYDEQIATLRAEVASLRQWKADAIARYPDLDVDPVVLEARRIVADEIGTSDPHLVQQVLDGRKDTILPMRVTINALNKGDRTPMAGG